MNFTYLHDPVDEIDVEPRVTRSSQYDPMTDRAGYPNIAQEMLPATAEQMATIHRQCRVTDALPPRKALTFREAVMFLDALSRRGHQRTFAAGRLW